MANTSWSATDKTAGVGLTNSNLTATVSAFGLQGVRTVDRQVSGKWYFEYTFVNVSGSIACGIASQAAGLGTTLAVTTGNAPFAAIVNTGGSIIVNNVFGAALAAPSAGSVIGLALDLTNQLIWFRLGAAGNWNNSASANPATGAGGFAINFVGGGIAAYGVMSASNANTAAITANFGDTAFTGAVPVGFTSGFTAGAVISNNVVSSQTSLDQWANNPSPDMQATQVLLEQWASTDTVIPQFILTQVLVDQWASVAVIPDTTQARAWILA